MSTSLPLGTMIHGSSLIYMSAGVIAIRGVRGAAEATPDRKDKSYKMDAGTERGDEG